MEIKGRFDHFNINVTHLDRSLRFYEKALGLREVGRKEAADGSFILVYLGDNTTGFRMELTWLRDHPQPYELGENESHLGLVTDDYEAARGWRAITTRPAVFIRKWGVSASKTNRWDCILSMIPTIIGLKSSPSSK